MSFLYSEKNFTGVIYLPPVTCGFFIGRSTRDTPPHTQYSTLYLRALGTSHCTAAAGNGKRVKPLHSLFLFFRCCPWLGGVGWWYGYCIHMHCIRLMYGIFPAYYYALRYIYASLRINIPYNIHLRFSVILPLFLANVEISMLVPFSQLFL